MPPDADAVQDQALAWLVRLNDNAADAGVQADFAAWLAAAPAHRAAFDEARRLWQTLREPAAKLGASGWHREPVATTHARLFTFGLARLALAGLCAFVIAGAVLLWQAADDVSGAGGQVYVTRTAAPEKVTLADGSVVHMDGHARIAVRYEDGLRKVDMQRGRAWFDVAHSGSPFVVRAGAVETRVLGTAFTVDQTNDAVTVTVERGRVAVSRDGEAGALTLSVGQQAQVGAHLPAAAAQVDIETAFAWRRGLLIFDRARLDAVADELDKLGGETVVLLGQDLRTETVSGTFQRRDRQAILEALRSGLGLKIVEIPGIAAIIYR